MFSPKSSEHSLSMILIVSNRHITINRNAPYYGSLIDQEPPCKNIIKNGQLNGLKQGESTSKHPTKPNEKAVKSQ